jgi:RHS repeat-associated protein
MLVLLRQLLAAILSLALATPMWAFAHDPVGNRTQKTSTLPGYPGGLTNYNANDQLSTDTYDSDGNTTASNGVGYVYDFENRLVQAGGGISIVYDGDGNRVSKTVAGVTTNYLVDDQNPTGYAQVVSETFSGGTGARELSHAYVYGLERISEQRSYFTGTQSLTQFIYYVYDGHGSVRALTDPTGAVTDTYDYDAFGNLIHSTGTTPNVYLYSGEQFDPDLGLYYNRARYLNTSTGRFWSMDAEEGNDDAPLSLHKYLYSQGDPINNVDPSGNEIDEIAAGAMSMTLDAMPSLNFMQVVKEVSDSLQLCCRSNVIDAMKTIWGQSGNGATGSEASFTVDGTLGNYTIQIQPYTNERKKQQLAIHPGITFAVFHVHPNNGGPKPSTPGNNAEGNPLGDTGVADKYKFDVYVVSRSGLWTFSWEQKKDVQLRENLDWTKPCSEKPLLPTKWVNP